MTELAPGAINACFTLFSNDANNYEGTSTSWAGVIIHLLRWHVTDALIDKSDQEVKNVWEGSLTTWDISRKLWDLTLPYGGVYNEQILLGSFLEGNWP